MRKIQFLLLLTLFGQVLMTNEVNIYTSRHYDSDDALYEEFRKETGIKVNIISGKGSALLERIKSEGKNSPADIFFTVDAGPQVKIVCKPEDKELIKDRLIDKPYVMTLVEAKKAAASNFRKITGILWRL